MKKKILSLAMIVCMLSIAIVGGTLAYFTDTDSAKNVMTTGKVDIVQYEKDKNGDDFDQNQPLMPMIDKRGENEPVVEGGFFNEKMINVVDKVITVKNEAAANAKNQDVYARTIIAFETARHYAENSTEVFTDMHKTYIGILDNDVEYLDRYIKINGVEYILAVRLYEEELAPQQESEASLKQIFLAPTANNEVADIFGDDYTILALSQATQVEGFEDAADALNTAFGDLATMDIDEIQDWFEAIA